MRIYIYSECCTRGGHVYRGENPEENGDLFLWSEGDEDQLIEEARGMLDNATPFSRRCARNVLDYLGAEVKPPIDLYDAVDRFAAGMTKPGEDLSRALLEGCSRPFTADDVRELAEWVREKAADTWGEDQSRMDAIAEGLSALAAEEAR